MSGRRDRDQGRGRSRGRPEREREEATIPVAEEQLNVEKREAELGEVQVRKTVEGERQTVPIELEREEVQVEQRDVGDRPVQPGDQAFQEGTVRVPVRGEEALVSKEAVVTGEVVLDKERTTEREQITDTLRRERVEVDEHDERARAGSAGRFEQGRAAAPPATGPMPRQTSREAEPQPRQSSGAGEGWEQLREQVREDAKR